MTTDQAETNRSRLPVLGRWFDWLHAHDVLTNVLHWPGTPREMPLEGFIDESELVVRADLAGLDPDHDIEIQVSDHTLHIRAERRENETLKRGAHWSEFGYGTFARSVPLPPNATETAVKATYTDGILEIRVPLDHEHAEVEHIPVQRA